MRFWIKMAFVAVMTLMILVPLAMIDGVISDRQQNRAEAVEKIAATFAGEQAFSGPVLVVPYTDSMEVQELDARDVLRTVRKEEQREWIFFPDTLDVGGHLKPFTRRLGLHAVRVYEWKAAASARFAAQIPVSTDPRISRRIGQPWLSYGITDVRGLVGTPRLTVDGQAREVAQGQGARDGAGLHVRLPAPLAGQAVNLSTRMEFVLGGTESLSLVPLGKTNRFAVDSTWPHPRLAGKFPARQPQIGQKGFQARWEVPALASEAQRQYRAGRSTADGIDAVSVSLVDPVNAYSQADRATKYGILFVLLTFVGFFMFELIKQLRIHPIQYGLVGLALSIFFLLLVSLSEHVDFGLSYLLASVACIGLIGYYLSHVLRSVWRGVGFSVMLAALYGALYGLLVSEDNALLLGSGLLFLVLAAIMVLTRKVDWYQLGGPSISEGTLREQLVD